MKLIFEHIIVNGYVIDVYGDVCYSEGKDYEFYYVHPNEIRITKDGFDVEWEDFIKFGSNELMFWNTIEDTEEENQQYLKEFNNGY